MRLAEALLRSVTLRRWLRWRGCLGGESRAGILLFVEEGCQDCWLPSSPPAGVCGWAGGAVTWAWSLADSVVEVMVPGKRKVTGNTLMPFFVFNSSLFAGIQTAGTNI